MTPRHIYQTHDRFVSKSLPLNIKFHNFLTFLLPPPHLCVVNTSVKSSYRQTLLLFALYSI